MDYGALIGIVSAGVNLAAQQKAAKAGQAAASKNAAIAAENSKLALVQGELDVVQAQKLNFLRVGGIRAAVGASGIKMEGSALDVLENTVSEQELNVQNIRYNAYLKSRGFDNTADLDRQRARAIAEGSIYGAAAGALLLSSKAYNAFPATKGAGTPIPVYAGGGTNIEGGD